MFIRPRYTRIMVPLTTIQNANSLSSNGSSASNANSIQAKQSALFDILRAQESVIVAYSGGADSAYLAWAAHHVLGERAIAITADSASLPESHKSDAEEFAREHGIAHEYISTQEFDNPDYLAN